MAQELRESSHIHLNHGKYVEEGIEAIKKELQNDEQIRHKYSTRYLSIKLLEMDKDTEKIIKSLPNGDKIIEVRDKAAKKILKETKDDSETAIMDAKYAFIRGALNTKKAKTVILTRPLISWTKSSPIAI